MITKKQFEMYLNRTGNRFASPGHWAHIKSRNIGTWLRVNDPLQFEIEMERFIRGEMQCTFIQPCYSIMGRVL